MRSVSEIKADMKLLEIELNEIEKLCKKEAHNAPAVNEDAVTNCVVSISCTAIAMNM